MCCLCYCKDTNFSANHNPERPCSLRTCVVYATAKILIFLQITTDRYGVSGTGSCLCYCKDTNFSANHNRINSGVDSGTVVYATAKILIFLQITTRVGLVFIFTCCLCYCKDTNFSANHNIHPYN